MENVSYIGLSRLSTMRRQMDVIANNLANVSTQGFRAELSTYRAVPLRGDGASTRVFAMEATSGHDEKPGAMQRTGRTLDMAAQGNAWFAVQGLDGTEAYTRSGSFQVSPEGTLTTTNGLMVLSDGGAPIDVPPGATLTSSHWPLSDCSVPGRPSRAVVASAGRGCWGWMSSPKLRRPSGRIT